MSDDDFERGVEKGAAQMFWGGLAIISMLPLFSLLPPFRKKT